MSLIKTLKDKDGNILYPQSTAEAVFINDGNNLQNKLNEYDNHQYLEQVAEMPEATADNIGQVVQYIGVSTQQSENDYLTGTIYECINDYNITNGTVISLNDGVTVNSFDYTQLLQSYDICRGGSYSIFYDVNDDYAYLCKKGSTNPSTQRIVSMSTYDNTINDYGINISLNITSTNGYEEIAEVIFESGYKWQEVNPVILYYKDEEDLPYTEPEKREIIDKIKSIFGSEYQTDPIKPCYIHMGGYRTYDTLYYAIPSYREGEYIVEVNNTYASNSYPEDDYGYLSASRFGFHYHWGTLDTFSDSWSTEEYYMRTEADEKFAKKSIYDDTAINLGRKENTSIGTCSTAEGYETTASGNYSHAGGRYATASAVAAHAEGEGTVASAYAAHAEGYYAEATGNYSHAESRSKASGESSHAEGAGRAKGRYSHAEGLETVAQGDYQHAQGKYNIVDNDNLYAHIVGHGTGAGGEKNIHTLNWSGEAWFQGDIYVGSTSGKNKDEGSKKLATEEYVNNNAMPASPIINAFWKGTQAEYDALASKNNTTLYLIQDEEV